LSAGVVLKPDPGHLHEHAPRVMIPSLDDRAKPLHFSGGILAGDKAQISAHLCGRSETARIADLGDEGQGA
jgi:hypothetical protein